MSLFDFLDRLREKKPEERLFISVATAATITGLIVVVWVLSVGVTLRSTSSASSVFESSSLDDFKKQIDGTVEQGQRVLDSLQTLGGGGTTTSTSTAFLATSTDTGIAPTASSSTAMATSTRIASSSAETGKSREVESVR